MCLKSFRGLSQYLEKYTKGDDNDVILAFLYVPAMANMIQGTYIKWQQIIIIIIKPRLTRHMSVTKEDESQQAGRYSA